MSIVVQKYGGSSVAERRASEGCPPHDVAELRAVLKRGDKNVSETWLYRWTKS
jgi:glucan biosynthesis protein